MRVNRREFLAQSAIAAAISTQPWLAAAQSENHSDDHRVPVIDVTDLYHPFEDPGDNLDLIQAHALPEVDLRAIVLDVTGAFRLPVANHPFLWQDPNGPREGGIIPVTQLNALFDRAVPYACGPYTPMKSLTDAMTDVPKIQQAGIELILQILQESKQPVDIVSFGSARTIAAAYNREPNLFRKKLGRIHVSAGAAMESSASGTLKVAHDIPGGEWNVALDELAFTRLMQSDLPISLYPCADADSAFAYGEHNTFWTLPNLHFVREIDPRLRNYVIFALGRMIRADFLSVLDGKLDEGDAQDRLNRVHNVWETAVWLNVARRKVVYRDTAWKIVPQADVRAGERALKNELRPCTLHVRKDGRIAYTLTNARTNFSIFERGDPHEYEQALREAVPAWWKTFRSRADA